jgi:hypothetical protein
MRGDRQGKGSADERPVHEVSVDAFAIGRFPVTVSKFRRFVEATGYRTEAERGGRAAGFDVPQWAEEHDASWHSPYFAQADNHPVVAVSWNDAVAYASGSLSRQESATRYPLRPSGSMPAVLAVTRPTAMGTTSSNSQRMPGTRRMLKNGLILWERNSRMTGSSTLCMAMSTSG